MRNTNNKDIEKNIYTWSIGIISLANAIGQPLIIMLSQKNLIIAEKIQYNTLLSYLLLSTAVNVISWLALPSRVKFVYQKIWHKKHKNIYINGIWYGYQTNPEQKNYFRYCRVTIIPFRKLKFYY
ncbi:hypothetical protein AGMMS49975_21740 [Clostridia bacterium]|nr:hypothetical protein AGMMS49975_21740 [Clostridia bacterium]